MADEEVEELKAICLDCIPAAPAEPAPLEAVGEAVGGAVGGADAAEGAVAAEEGGDVASSRRLRSGVQPGAPGSSLVPNQPGSE